MPPRKRRGETSASSADATACGRAPGDVQPDNAVDAFVEGDGWYYAQCLAADADRVRVHFQGWPEADDCWLPRSEVIGDDLGRGAMTTIRHSFQNMARATSDNYDAWRAAASGRPAKRARGAAPPAARRAAKSAARPLSSGDSLAALPPPPAAKKARAAPRPEAAPAPAAAAPSPPVEAGGKTSRFTGVQWDAWSGKWKALVVVHGHNIPLGYFDVEEDAARAYDAARVKWQALVSNSKRPPNFPGEPDEATLAALPPLPSQLQTPARLAPRRRSAPGPAPDARLGRWVEVYWTGDSAWYLGRVEGQRTGSTGGVELQVAYVDDETIYQALRTEPFAGDGAPPYVQGTQPDSWRFAEAPAATTKPAAKPRALKPATKPRAAAAKPATEDFDALVARDAPIERTEKARGGRTRSASIEAATTAREYFSRGGKKPDLKYDLKNGFFRVRAAGAPAADPPDEAEEEPVAKPRAAPAPAAKKQRTAPLPKAAPRARPPRAARGTPDARIGQWVEVYWASEGAWYLGRVDSTRYSDGAGAIELRVDYTDDETHYQVFQDDAFAGAGDPPAQPDGAPERWRFATGPTPPSPKQQQGRWTPREEDDLCKVVAELGEAQWKAVAERLGTGRTAHGVEFRWGFLTGKNDGSKSTGQKPHAPRPVASPTAARKSRTPPKSAPAPRPQSPRTARSAPTTAPPPPGSRVAVRFADGKEYKGTVADALDKNRATVNYDDGQSEAVRFPDPDVRVMRVGSGWPLAPAAPGREARLTRRRGAEEEAQLTEAMNRSLVDASEAPPSPEAPPTPPSPAPRRPAIGALVDDAPAPARFKYVYPPKKAGGSWTTCVTLHGVSTSAGSHRTKTAAGRAIDAMLLAHGKPAVNFPGEEEASKAAFPGITTSGRVSRAKAPRRAAKAPQSRPKPRRAPKPAPRKTRTPSKYTGVHGAERQGAPTAWRTDVAVNGTTYHYEHATEREAAISYDAVRVMYRGEARLNFPERWPGDDSSRYAGVARNADAVTTRAPWRAHHDSHELGSFDDEKVAARVYDFARRSKGQPVVNFDGSGEHGEMFCAYCEDWEIAAVAQKDEAPLVKKYGRRFFEDSEHPGEVYYVVHTGVQWRTDGMAMVKVDVVGPRDMSGAMPGPFVVGPCESTEVGENATMYMLNDALRSMIAATPQGLQVVAKEGDAPVPQLQLPEFVPEPFVEETRDPMAPLGPRRRPVVAPEAPEAPPASKPRRPPAPSAGQQRAAALDAEDAADGWTPPSKADSDARCLRACEACRAAGLGVRACLVDRRHAAGVAPRGFARFCDALRAAGVPFPDAPPAEGAVCAAVDAALSGVAVPTHFVDVVRGRRGYVKEFANRESKLTTVIQGGRRSVYVDGGDAGPFRAFADGKQLDGRQIRTEVNKKTSRRTNAEKFLETCRCAIAYRAAFLWPRSHAVHLSADMLCLVGAPAAQVPHVDLIPDQCQAVMALTRQAPTLVLRRDAAPTVAEAFARVGIDAASTTKWADLIRAAPALSLDRPAINRGMVDATRWSTARAPTDAELAAAQQAAQGRRRRSTAADEHGVDGDCRPVSRDAWDAGSLFLADHKLVHAGPRCTQPGPRVVLFTTFTVQAGDAAAATYDPRDQYMPYFLAEDPSMSDRRAMELLHHWREEKPWDHYPDSEQSLAVKLLATRGPELPEEKRREAVARMRAVPPE